MGMTLGKWRTPRDYRKPGASARSRLPRAIAPHAAIHIVDARKKTAGHAGGLSDEAAEANDAL
jgi:hypothetical protein